MAALGGGHDGQVVFVSLFSVANAAGEQVEPGSTGADHAPVCGALWRQHLQPKACTGLLLIVSRCCPAGRLLMGYIPEQHLHARGTPRTVFLTLTAAVTAVSCLAVAYANLSHLYIISVLLGMAFGAHWSLLPAITR